jgi:hypothetical protein
MLKLITSTGASVIDINYQIDIYLVKNKVGNDICIRDNSNTTTLGTHKRPEDIIKEITDTIIAGKSGGRCLYATGSEQP